MIPDLTVLWVVLMVLVLSLVLDRLVVKPVVSVMRQREQAVLSARELADTSRTRAEAALAELESRTRAARAEVYKEMDARRRAALDRRAGLLAGTRAEVDSALADAAARLETDVADARGRLTAHSEALAGTVVERILGRRVS